MKASDVQVRPTPGPEEIYVDPEFVLVQTVANRRSKLVTTIEHISRSSQNEAGRKWYVDPLFESTLLTHSSAIELARTYAAGKDICVVFELKETGEPTAH